MAFVDQTILAARAGKGGDGVVRWLHEKGKEFGGPSGGDGGNGGNVIFRGIRDLQILAKYRGRGAFRALNGGNGQGKEMAGKNGEDVIIDVPVGAVVTRKQSGQSFEILEEGQEVIALRGGRGGLGNTHFKSSTNQFPEEAVPGKPGEEDKFRVELRIIADVGLIGLPNAGKSSLLNSLTRAKSKVGAYAFTTLEPHLGVFYGYIIADIPGLIEGATEGKGLGHQFLRHVSRTRLLVHCISVESGNPLKEYETVRKEIAGYSEELSQKPEIIFLTKTDMVTEKEATSLEDIFTEKGLAVVPVSVIDDALLKEAGDSLVRFLQSQKIPGNQ
jgi:GTP-binding protein